MMDATALQAIPEKLTHWFRARGHASAEVLALQSASGGYSNITLVGEMRLEAGGPVRGIVLRLQPEGAAVFPDCDVRIQYQTMTLLQGTDLPIPSLLGLENDAAVLGAPFFIMGRIDGLVPNENPPYHMDGWFHAQTPKQLRDSWFAGVDGLSKLALLDWRTQGFSFLLPADGETPLAKQRAYYAGMLRWSEGLSGRPYALLWRTHDWLASHQPQNEPTALSWGDAKLGNCVFQEGKLVGMLDWERPALTNPVDDLSWWLMLDESLCTGYGLPRLVGLPSREETVAYWEKRSGFSASDLPYYDVFSAWRFAIIMTRIGHIFTQRAWVPPEAEMDSRNGGSRLVELLAERHHF